MRTTGTFTEVYHAARAYSMGLADDCPMDPVVRRDSDGEWVLESGIHGAPEATFECTLEHFHAFFWEEYIDPGYTPSESDIAEFLHGCGEGMERV